MCGSGHCEVAPILYARSLLRRDGACNNVRTAAADMKPIPALVRRTSRFACDPLLRSPIVWRRYAAQSPPGSSRYGSGRRAVTPFNDDGHVPWTELSAGEKTARAAQQTFNLGMVILGIVLTVSAVLDGPPAAAF